MPGRRAVLGTRHIFVDASRVTAIFFRNFSPRNRRFASSVINFQLLKLVSTPIRAHTADGQTLPSPPSDYPHPSPPSGHLPPFLLAGKLCPLRPAVILIPPHPVVILQPSSWRLNSPHALRLSVILHPYWWSSSTPPHPAVILHPSCCL